MASNVNDESGFSASDIAFARETFFRDCPNGRCSKRKFLTFIRQSSNTSPLTQKNHSIRNTLISSNSRRQSKKFFSTMFDIYDQNHDGELDFDEYLYALSALSGANRPRTIETLYRYFDHQQRGYITRQAFNSRKRLAAQCLGRQPHGIQDCLFLERAFDAMDLDKDGRISKEEFTEWYLKDRSIAQDELKPVKKRTRLLQNLTSLVDGRGQIKTSSLQQDENNKHPIDAWLETTTPNVHLVCSSAPINPSIGIDADRQLLRIFRRARNRFIQYRRMSIARTNETSTTATDDQSDSGIYTSSSLANFNDDFESNSLLDTDDDNYLKSISSNDADSELLYESLEAVLMETILELRHHRQQRSCSTPNTNNMNTFELPTDQEPVLICRL